MHKSAFSLETDTAIIAARMAGDTWEAIGCRVFGIDGQGDRIRQRARQEVCLRQRS